MIVTDTNVLSEPLRLRPDPRVLTWLEERAPLIAITSITVGELQYGVMRLPSGKRREALAAAVDALVERAGDRMLSYTAAAAHEYAILRAERETAGRPLSVEDGMIAGICRAGGYELATRNVRDFDGSALIVHNPWTDV